MSVEKGRISLLWKGVDLESTKGIWEQGGSGIFGIAGL